MLIARAMNALCKYSPSCRPAVLLVGPYDPTVLHRARSTCRIIVVVSNSKQWFSMVQYGSVLLVPSPMATIPAFGIHKNLIPASAQAAEL